MTPNNRPHLGQMPKIFLAAAVFLTLGLDIYDCVQIFNIPDPEIRFLLWTAIAESLIDLGFLIAIYVLLNRSLWQQWRQTKEVEEASAAKSEILSIVSHDLRSPLSVIMGFSEMLRERDNDPENQRLIKRIIANTGHTLNLINDLVSQTALEGGALRVKKNPASVTGMVKDAVDSQMANAVQKSIGLTCSAEENLVAPVDQQKFRQILENLIGNAIKYSPQGRPVSVSLSAGPRAFRLSVRDEGPGLDQAERIEVFNKFSKVKKRPTGGEYSTGLGLSITKKLVELHDGEIWVESEGPGRGSTFHVELPR